jgi:DNA-binding SARP family transcriptional activator
MRVRLLGPIDVVVDGQARPVSGLRRRALLVALALRRGAVLDRDHLVELIWPVHAPRAAANALQSHVSYLRELAGDRTAIRFRAPGYVLPAGGEETDVEAAERLVDQAVRDPDPADRARQLRDALAQWRGDALAGITALPWFEEQADRLAQLRRRAGHGLVQARLDLGEHEQLLPELRHLVRDSPFDEQVHGQLILALYRSDRQADALAAYHRLRDTLRDELGIDPGPAVRALETAILRQDPALRSPAPPRPPAPAGPPQVPPPETRPALSLVHDEPADARTHRPPAQLPAPTAAFTGRSVELARLDRLDRLLGPGVPAIATVAGTAGVGKTALVLHWAHRSRDRFADGQLFVDLRGFSADRPVRPIDALTGFLAALGVPPEQAPVQVDQAAALYRTLVAGQRLLIVLDNARSAEQVRPLLPGEPGCLVLITSRDRLAGLAVRNGAQPIRVDPLSPAEADDLLTHLLGPPTGPAADESLVELSRACAFLPLALRIAAATLAWQPGRPVADFVAQLRADTLATLSIEDDPEAGIAAAFDASYRSLPDPVRRLFRWLSLAPGPDISVAATAALVGTGPVEAAA